jgi:hypothetical protein
VDQVLRAISPEVLYQLVVEILWQSAREIDQVICGLVDNRALLIQRFWHLAVHDGLDVRSGEADGRSLDEVCGNGIVGPELGRGREDGDLAVVFAEARDVLYFGAETVEVLAYEWRVQVSGKWTKQSAVFA